MKKNTVAMPKSRGEIANRFIDSEVTSQQPSTCLVVVESSSRGHSTTSPEYAPCIIGRRFSPFRSTLPSFPVDSSPLHPKKILSGVP
ncbi:unnamed protein product [Pseudo-nitzschia multistriata]|uniref:Uncharacterized protein n=1 Tax=Pseudo-nitzschia multistriata TaxID=183589 RepID=A0A448ZS46_9STRA|nr:unnamed protein product [Pseudo-nitzschia multistriata]